MCHVMILLAMSIHLNTRKQDVMETTIQNQQAQQTLPARIDRLPIGRELGTIMLLAGFAWLIESYDIGIIGNILPLLQKQYQLTTLDHS